MDLQRAVWNVFSIRKKEARFVLPLFLLYLLSGSFYAFGQIYTETIFLKTYGAQGLARFFVYNGIALVAAGIVYNLLVLRLTLRRGYYALVGFFSFLIICAIFAADKHYPWLPFYLFLGNYLFTFFLDIHFFNFIFQYLSIRSARRVVPLLMGGGKLGGIVAALLIFSFFSTDIATKGALLWLINGIMIVLPLLALGSISGRAETRKAAVIDDVFSDSRFWNKIIERLRLSKSVPVFASSILAVLSMAVVNLIAEFYFAKFFNAAFPSPAQLAGFLSVYTFCADFITLAAQMFLTARIIARLGVQNSNLVYPASFLLFMSAAVFSPGILAGTALRFFRKNVSVIIRQPVFNVIIAAVPREKAAQVKSFISGIVLPVGMVAGGMVLHVFRMVPEEVAWFIAGLFGTVYLVVSVYQNRAYVASLRGHLDMDLQESSEAPLTEKDYAAICQDPRQAARTPELYEALYLEYPRRELFLSLYPHFGKLGRAGKEKVLAAIGAEEIEIRMEVILAALKDADPLIRGLALGEAKKLPFDAQKFLFDSIPRAKLMSEEFARDYLYARARKRAGRAGGTDIEASSFLTNLLKNGTDDEARQEAVRRLSQIRYEVLDGDLDPVEFFILTRVLEPADYARMLVNCTVKTGSGTLLRALSPLARDIDRAIARRVLFACRAVALPELIGFMENAAKLAEIDKALLLDFRNDLSDRDMSNIFCRDEQLISILSARLFQSYPYHRKANYLNYFISLDIKPAAVMKRFIEHEIGRTGVVKDALARLGPGGPDGGMSAAFLRLALIEEIGLHKKLILKAVGMLTGIDLDEVYESGIFLKDRDITGYIVEYIDSSGRYPRDTARLFEAEGFDGETVADSRDYAADVAEVMRRSWAFMPESAGLVKAALRMLPEENGQRLRRNAGREAPDDGEVYMLNLMGKIIFLKENRIFQDIQLSDLIHIARVTKEVELPPNKVFLREGETGDDLFIVIDGEVEVFTDQKSIELLGSGSCIGELSIIDAEPRSANVRTRKKTRLMVLNRKEFLLTLKDNPGIAINVMQVLAQRLRKMLD